MNIDWVKSVDSHNISLFGLENKFRTKAELSTADIFDDIFSHASHNLIIITTMNSFLKHLH